MHPLLNTPLEFLKAYYFCKFLTFLTKLFVNYLSRQHANLAGTLSGHSSWVLDVAFCPDNKHFVSR